MRKTILPAEGDAAAQAGEWLDLEPIARVELTSEDPDHPVESALTPDGGGWRAAEPGEQTIRILFDAPQRIRRILLEFEETGTARTQEFVVRWSPSPTGATREVVRQRWNFSPDGSTREVEELSPDLDGVAVLELAVTPDVSGGDARASLARLLLA